MVLAAILADQVDSMSVAAADTPLWPVHDLAARDFQTMSRIQALP